MLITIQEVFYSLASVFLCIVLIVLIWAAVYILRTLRKVERAAYELHTKIQQIVAVLDFLPTHTRLIAAGITELISFLKGRSERNKTPSNFHPNSLHKED